MIIILDFGSQYTQLIARRIREMNVFSEIHPCHYSPDQIDLEKLEGIILSGGPASVSDSDAPKFDKRWLTLGKPVLGVCYGMQLISSIYGAPLHSGAKREYGLANIELVASCPLVKGFEIGQNLSVWMSHGDHVDAAPKGFQIIASSSSVPVAVIANEQEKIYAVQFHPEVVHTPCGKEILNNFVFEICKCAPNWTSADFIESTANKIQAEVGEANVICGLSGGVDSTVAAVLVNIAIKGRLHCIFVDNGLLREGEALAVFKNLGAEGLGLNVQLVDASERFLKELEGVTDPEQKRKIIGRVFIEVFDEAAQQIANVTHLVQGTLYPDVIESVSVKGGPSVTIKTHHNVGGLPETMKLKLIEPFRELFKDEVRRLGTMLKIPEPLIRRQPFPGPGLAVRILGAVTKERLTMLRKADQIYQDEIRKAGLYDKLWQSFAVLLPINSVGVMGDNRTYEQTIGLRAVTSEDGMTADWYYLPHALLQTVSNRIINEISGINRVVLDISSKPPATIEWE